MLLFSKRKQLERLFLRWCHENNIAESPFNAITYLQAHGLIDEEKTKAFLDSAEKEKEEK